MPRNIGEPSADFVSAGKWAVGRPSQWDALALCGISLRAGSTQQGLTAEEQKKSYCLLLPIERLESPSLGWSGSDATGRRGTLIFSPTSWDSVDWPSDGYLLVLIDKGLIRRRAEQIAGKPIGPVAFATEIDTSLPKGRVLLAHVRLMIDASICQDPVPLTYVKHLRDAFVSFLLDSFSTANILKSGAQVFATNRSIVGRAETWIRQNAAKEFTVNHVANAIGVSLRSLQAKMREHRDMTLMQMIQDVRLEQLRLRLQDPLNDETVTHAAHAVGLRHLGRAAAAYRRRYGETPIETIERCRSFGSIVPIDSSRETLIV